MASIQDLITQKQYDKALQRIQVELKKKPKDQRLRLRQADVLIYMGRQREGVMVLLGLADDHAADGFTAKAIALLKRIEKLEPNRADVRGRLASLVKEKVSHVPSRPAPTTGFEFGMEEFDPSAEIGFEAPAVSVDAPAEPAPPAFPAPEPAPPAFAAEPEPLEITPDPEPIPIDGDADLEGLDFVEVEAEVEPEADAEPEPAGEGRSFLASPLFEGLSEEELMAFVQGLNFDSYEAGDVVVTEGAPGESMYIITTGRVKAFVKDRTGQYRIVKTLDEGDFFGEISVLTGRPRTATITAAEDCEVLELDRKTLDAITRKYPRVREVLKKAQERRAEEAVEALLRKQ